MSGGGGGVMVRGVKVRGVKVRGGNAKRQPGHAYIIGGTLPYTLTQPRAPTAYDNADDDEVTRRNDAKRENLYMRKLVRTYSEDDKSGRTTKH